MADRRLVNAVTRELLLVDPHEKQVLYLIQNLRALLLGCDESHALSHREALDVLLLLDDCGDGGGSFAVLAGNVYDLLAFLVLFYISFFVAMIMGAFFGACFLGNFLGDMMPNNSDA